MSKQDPLAEIEATWTGDELHRAEFWADRASRDIPWLISEVQDRRTDLAMALTQLQNAIGEIKRLRKFPAVWAVRYGNYEPSEVIALYDNERAARDHAAMSDDPLEVEEMEIRSEPPHRPT